VPIPLNEFYRAILGLGNGAPVDLVRKLLLGSKIVAVDVSPRSERTIIKSLTFTDGTKMHFGISQLGACIYNVEEVNSEVRTGTAAESSDSNRKETGRNTEVVVGDVTDKLAARHGSAGASATVEPRTKPVPDVSATGGVSTGTTARDE
jgi:hypothetical protein